MHMTIPFFNRLHPVALDMRMICDIERELGALPALGLRLEQETWTISELVALMQILLQAAGVNADFMELGDDMLKTGLGTYKSIARACARVCVQEAA